MIDFYTDWCGFCKQLDRTTWQDAKVLNWLSEKTVPIKINAEMEREISKKYRIESYPTILFLKPDGNEIDRLGGYKNALDFMQEANAAISGKDSAARAKEALLQNKGDSPDVRTHLITTPLS
jgi:thiol-disulfide isomerase/thioredoxin